MKVLADDLDRTVDSEKTPVLPWTFSFGPRNNPQVFNIDLTEKNYKKLVDALAPFAEVAAGVDEFPEVPSARVTRARRQGGSQTARRDPEQVKAIREWARANGYPDLGDRGRIPQEIEDKFAEAHAIKAS